MHPGMVRVRSSADLADLRLLIPLFPRLFLLSTCFPNETCLHACETIALSSDSSHRIRSSNKKKSRDWCFGRVDSFNYLDLIVADEPNGLKSPDCLLLPPC